MIKITQKGDFKKTSNFFDRILHLNTMNRLRNYGEMGVTALAEATPKDTGRTADSWSYQVEKTNGGYSITWLNSSENQGVSIAILLQYGHATVSGGWVEGRDYINTALKPVFEAMADDMWQEVTSS